MALEEYEHLMMRDNRCGYCKVVPHAMTKNLDYEWVCPSSKRYHFHAYSAGGRTIIALSLLRGRLEYTDGMLDVIYRCQMDGGCDVSCKVNRDLEPFEVMLELRAKSVEDGQMLPEHMIYIDGLKKEDNMMLGEKADRGKWAEGLDVKDLSQEKAEVLYHAGCRTCYDEDLWPTTRRAVTLLRDAGVDIGIMGKDEVCCGGRAYEWGYQGELVKYAEHNTENWKNFGIKRVVTSCACGYQAFKVLYDKIGLRQDGIEILHISQYLERLIREGKLKPRKDVPMTVTYHDPCHLGRLAEPWVHWNGKEVKVMGQYISHDPPKEFRRGANGVYEPPRNVIKSIPGLTLVEMDRIREYALCCGAGGGVKEAYPDFALWTADARIEESENTGAEAIVTACPHCVHNLQEAIDEKDHKIKVYNILDLVDQSI
jgi:Fe-S oxidoreductase